MTCAMTITRKKRDYDEGDIKQFFLKNKLSKNRMWREFLRLMRRYDRDDCACEPYEYDCVPHSLLYWFRGDD